MYTVKNYKSKKELVTDFKLGKKIEVYQPGPFEGTRTGRAYLEGPHYPQPHKWYASVEIEDFIITKINK